MASSITTPVRPLSPELALVDSELAEHARELLLEPGGANGKGNHMSALGTHEITAGTSFGLEPPLSPPVVGSPPASALPVGDGLAGLPTPPPAIRPPEGAAPVAAPPPVAAPAVHAEASVQPEPAAAPVPVPVPVPAEPELAAVAPAEPVLDYFAAEEPATVEELPPVAAPVPEPEVQAIPLMAPATEPAEQLPAMAPSEPEAAPAAVAQVELAPIASPADEPAPFIPASHEPEPAAALEEQLEQLEQFVATPVHAEGFHVVVRLKHGEGVVEVGSFRDFGTAMDCAQEVIEQFASATDGQWPFYAGRFIRPDLIVSVDVVDGETL